MSRIKYSGLYPPYFSTTPRENEGGATIAEGTLTLTTEFTLEFEGALAVAESSEVNITEGADIGISTES